MSAKNEVGPSLHHVTMKTSRLDEMIKWYALVVGSQVLFRNETAAWTTNDDANHRIAFLAVPGLSDDADKVRHNGMHHCAFEYSSFAELMSTYDRLRKAGVEPAFSLDHGMTMSLYYKDLRATLLNCKVITFPTGGFRESTCEDPHNLPQIQLASFLIQPASMRLLGPAPISRPWKKRSIPAFSYPIPSQISVCRAKRCYA